MEKFNNSNQLKAYMKKEAERLNLSIPNAYNTYFSRNFLEKISYDNRGLFLVKGSFSQYVHIGHLVRPITDIDLVTPYKTSDVISYISEVLFANQEGIKYKITRQGPVSPNSVTKVCGLALFDTIAQPIRLDIKDRSQSIYEWAYKPVNPIFEKDETYYVNTPSMEEHIAEKLCIIAESIVTRDNISRMKDFYDVFELHGGVYDFDKLSIYFARMLKERGNIDLSDASTEPLNMEFVNKYREMWRNMSEKYEFMEDTPIEEAIFYTRGVLSEQLQKARKLTLK